MGKNKQTVTISFVTATNSDDFSLNVELDDDENSLANNGRTSNFIYGDTVFFRVFSTSIQELVLACSASDGIIGYYGKKSLPVIGEILHFSEPILDNGGLAADSKVALSRVCVSGFSIKKIANSSASLGVLSIDPADPTSVISSVPGPGVYVASYTTEYYSFSIQQPTIPSGFPPEELEADTPYPIVVVITVGE